MFFKQKSIFNGGLSVAILTDTPTISNWVIVVYFAFYIEVSTFATATNKQCLTYNYVIETLYLNFDLNLWIIQ